MSATSRMTEANGIDVYDDDDRPSDPARSLAAALPRGDPSVERIRTCRASHDRVKVKVTAGHTFVAPPGWRIVSVYRSETANSTNVRLERDD